MKLRNDKTLWIISFLLASVGLIHWSGWSTSQISLTNSYLPPFQHRLYWLGTDRLGRDVSAMLLSGYETTILISLPIMLLAVGIGIVLGGLAGYFQKVRIYLLAFLLKGIIVGCILWEIYITIEATNLGHASVYGWLFISVLGVIWAMIHFLQRKWEKLSFWTFYLPIDQLFIRLTELLSSVPRLVLILCLATLLHPSYFNFGFVILITYWIPAARLMRAEVLRIKQQYYVEAAKANGLQDFYILWKHALPNALPTIRISFVFCLTSLIILESTLSFLGVGLPPETVSWGKMIAQNYQDGQHWWLTFFPVLGLLLVIGSLHYLADSWQEGKRKWW
ncbi:MAG: ABC transporter permease [Bacteroidota bacterium]